MDKKGKFFTALDTNKDERISSSEFTSYCLDMKQTRGRNALQSFIKWAKKASLEAPDVDPAPAPQPEYQPQCPYHLQYSPREVYSPRGERTPIEREKRPQYANYPRGYGHPYYDDHQQYSAAHGHPYGTKPYAGYDQMYPASRVSKASQASYAAAPHGLPSYSSAPRYSAPAPAVVSNNSGVSPFPSRMAYQRPLYDGSQASYTPGLQYNQASYTPYSQASPVANPYRDAVCRTTGISMAGTHSMSSGSAPGAQATPFLQSPSQYAAAVRPPSSSWTTGRRQTGGPCGAAPYGAGLPQQQHYHFQQSSFDVDQQANRMYMRCCPPGY